MGRSSGNYGGYRGRRTLTDILRIIAIVLGAAVVLVLAGLFLAQDYIVYTDEGLRLELPFFKNEPQGADESALDPGSITIKEQAAPGTSGSASSAQAEPEAAMMACQLPLGSLLDGSAEAALLEAGANTLIVEMKGGDGKLAWRSEAALAQQAQVNGTAEVEPALERLQEKGITTVARVCCFRDDSIPYYDTELALRTSSGNWRDEKGLRWLSPACEPAREYLAELCGELAQMGFDQVLLESFAFPTEGELDRIVQGERYDPQQWSGQVQAFLEQVEQELSPYHTQLALMVEWNSLSENGSNSGLAVQMLGSLDCQIWMGDGEGQEELETLLTQAGVDRSSQVKIVAQLDQQAASAQAVLAEST